MSRLNDFLTEAGTFFLATADGSQPKCRPIGAHLEKDGKILFVIGQHKDVYRQLQKNPLAEIVAFSKGKWLRYTGKAVFDTDGESEHAMIEAHPYLSKMYNGETGHKIAVFHLTDAEANIIGMAGEKENAM